jgi:hypothetical protein
MQRIDKSRRKLLLNAVAMFGAALASGYGRAIAVFVIQIWAVDDANVSRVIPSRLYVSLTTKDLAEAREALSRMSPIRPMATKMVRRGE